MWFTIARGSLSEVYFPSVDRLVLNGLRFLIAAPGSEPLDDARDGRHTSRWYRPGIPAFTVETVHREYRMTKEFVTDPMSDALLISGTFDPLLPDLKLYVQAEPHMRPGSEGNQGAVLPLAPPVLVVRQADVWIAIVGPFGVATVGYLNSSDLHVGLHDGDGELFERYQAAGEGNVALGAEVGLKGGPFQIAIGFAEARADAEEIAREALRKGAGSVREMFERAWMAQPDLPPNLARVGGDGGQLARCSLAVLRSLEDKSTPGAFIAAPAAPWGETGHDGDQIYHLVWPRDLCNVAAALVDAGDEAAGLRALSYLESTQRPDGSWAQNFDVAGSPHWTGLELDETALPVLLAWRLVEAGAREIGDLYRGMIGPAAAFIARTGPLTPLDRWEDGGGVSPSTLAVAVAALVVAAELAAGSGEEAAASHLRAVADYWQDRVEEWCYAPNGGFYVRLEANLDGPGPYAAPGMEFLELVRRGIRAPDHPCVAASLKHVDAILRTETPAGPAWHRYVADAYGEKEDGSPWGGGREGRGRAWPLLTGERAHLELALGRPARDLVAAMEAFAGPELLLPEQVWDGPEISAWGLSPGGPTGSARPLGWAHAEYVRLLASIAGARISDVVEPARRRYVESPGQEPAFVWSAAHALETFLAGRSVRVQLEQPSRVLWSGDGWASSSEAECRDTGLGLYFADLPTGIMRPGATMEWRVEPGDGSSPQVRRLTCGPQPD